MESSVDVVQSAIQSSSKPRRLLYRYAKSERTKLRDGGVPQGMNSRVPIVRINGQLVRLSKSCTAARGTQSRRPAGAVPFKRLTRFPGTTEKRGRGMGVWGKGTWGLMVPSPGAAPCTAGFFYFDVAKHEVVADNYPLRARGTRRLRRRAARHNMSMRRSERLITNGSGSRRAAERTIGYRDCSERTGNDPCSARVRHAR